MIQVSESAFEEMLAACRAAYPSEACGLLLGRPEWILETAPCRNVAANPDLAFQIDPVFHVRLQREARARGLAILGSFHSHPEGEAAPSLADAAGLSGGGGLHLICAVRAGIPVEARLFAWAAGKNAAHPFRLVEQPLQLRKAVA